MCLTWQPLHPPVRPLSPLDDEYSLCSDVGSWGHLDSYARLMIVGELGGVTGLFGYKVMS